MGWIARATTGLLLIALSAGIGAADQPARDAGPRWEVAEPPAELIERLELDPFYRKHVSVAGFPIVSSEKVADAALLEAAWIVSHMLDGNDAIREAMIANGTRLTVMGVDELTTDVPEHSDLEPSVYWDRRARGLGATHWRPAVSCGEENLLNYRGDPYIGESILVHEFAHAMHQMGLDTVDPEFDKRLRAIYKQAMDEGLWEEVYAAENHHEYWAEGVQSWFGTNRVNDHDHNHVDTREELEEYDPRLAALIAEVFGDTTWTYTPPSERGDQPHLRGYDRDTAPRFAWPEGVSEAYEAHMADRAARQRQNAAEPTED